MAISEIHHLIFQKLFNVKVVAGLSPEHIFAMIPLGNNRYISIDGSGTSASRYPIPTILEYGKTEYPIYSIGHIETYLQASILSWEA